MKRLFTLWLSLLTTALSAQTTLTLTSIPANTPAGATVYVAGTFNNWDPGSPAYALTVNASNNQYSITLPATVTGSIEYKFTRGTWPTGETGASNAAVPNRRYTVGSGSGPVLHTVLNWQDLGGPGGGGATSTAAANVQVISTSFAMPQLGRTRRVWLYLPPAYAANPTRRYPVLYMHDGQNVFDAATSFSGEWGVDEALNQLAASGQDAVGCIVVAIDNGGTNRLNEYSPWANPQYGGGQGDQYLDFITQTLKPYIDSNYRTQPAREFTGIGGSSMGGLISTYAALRHPTVFGKVLSFSPAYWFAYPQLLAYARQHPANPNTRFYFMSGTTESLSLVPQMTALRDSLQRGGVPVANLRLLTLADGQHSEWFWRREFPAAYQWLFAPAAPSATSAANRLKCSVFPNPTGRLLRVALPAGTAGAQLVLRDNTGRIVRQTAVRPSQDVDVSGLPAGVYNWRISAGNRADSGRFVRE